MAPPRILIYLLRRDLRLADNPVFHDISGSLQQSQQAYSHLLPLYIFHAQQLEVSGFLSSPEERSPFPEARSRTAGFWRCGPHRVKFLAESVWDLKSSLEAVGSGLVIRVGMAGQTVQDLMDGIKEAHGEVIGVWMTSEEGFEEKRDEKDVRKVVESAGKEFRLWRDEKYLIDDQDLPFKDPRDLPDVFTTFRKTVEPLRNMPRPVLTAPSKLPPLPPFIPAQLSPFSTPSSLEMTISALMDPLDRDVGLENPPSWPKSAESARPFHGGSSTGHERVKHLIESGRMSSYKQTRNGLLGTEFSTKLSAWLTLGCITARQIHHSLVDFEDALTETGKDAQGYGAGENAGTAAVRFELLWRDYMRLCTRKFGAGLFRITGFRGDTKMKWKAPSKDPDVQHIITRFLSGMTGIGLIDASMREIFLTGYTGNRARQNVASFLAKHLSIDWRIGAEWYEYLLTDYDVNSNWGNWQYMAGVGNDPRGEARIFNPVKQGFDYDPKGEYVKMWIPELSGIEDPQVIFQAWRMEKSEQVTRGLQDVEWVQKPLKKFEFHVGRGGGARSGWISYGQYNPSTPGGQDISDHDSGRGGGESRRGHGRGGGLFSSRGGGGYRRKGRGAGSDRARAKAKTKGQAQQGNTGPAAGEPQTKEAVKI